MSSAQLLIVDDDRLILHTLSSGLRSSGYLTLEADSGEEAVKISQEHPIDLAIVDIRMPGMSGVELAERLRADAAIPCIFLSAYADAAMVERAIAEGALGYLVKPLDVANIVPSIEAALVRAKELSGLKRAQAQLGSAVDQARLEGAACLTSIVDSAMDAIITVDEAQRILVFNRAAEAIFGCKAADAIGQSFERFLPARFRSAHEAHVQSFFAAGTTARAMGQRREVVGLRSNGEEFPVEATIAGVMVGGRKRATVMLRDVSERRRIEEARAQLEVQLRESQKMEAIGTLAGGIAHDFNSIVAAIMGNAALARQKLDAGHRAQLCLEEISRAGERAKGLVRQILAFSRKQAQEMVEQPLQPLVEEAISLLRAILPVSVDISCACAIAPLVARVDATQIEQVLLNLGTNAWHAVEGRSGRIEIRLEEVMLDAAAVQDLPGLTPGCYARLSVSDNGRGMDVATKARMFEPFFTTKERGRGTGLGLAVVHGIVKAHGGAITVRSALGEGSTFELYFPVVAAAYPEVASEATAIRPAEGGGRHLLYVDDDEALVFLYVRMLERHGYRVSGFARVQAALAAVRAHPASFDLALTDFNMPDMSGLDFARELARIRPDLPVVITSGYITQELKSQAREAGVRDVIFKPGTIEEMCRFIEPLLAPAGARVAA